MCASYDSEKQFFGQMRQLVINLFLAHDVGHMIRPSVLGRQDVNNEQEHISLLLTYYIE